MSDREFSRRSVTRAAAWSVPVLALAVTAPAASASGVPLDVALAGVCTQGEVGASGRGFTIAVSGADLPAGSIFQMTTSAGFSGTFGTNQLVFIPAPVVPATFHYEFGGLVTITINEAIPAATSVFLGIGKNDVFTSEFTIFGLTSLTADAAPLNNAATTRAGRNVNDVTICPL